jgi:ADP-ribose pyrophosphatase YjhB (NUDIX family)
VAVADSAVLLVRPQPQGDLWRLPGGELDHGEHPHAAALRHLAAQCGLQPDRLEVAFVDSQSSPEWRLTFYYVCYEAGRPAAGSDVAEARYFQMEHLPELVDGHRTRDAIYRAMTE